MGSNLYEYSEYLDNPNESDVERCISYLTDNSIRHGKLTDVESKTNIKILVRQILRSLQQIRLAFEVTPYSKGLFFYTSESSFDSFPYILQCKSFKNSDDLNCWLKTIKFGLIIGEIFLIENKIVIRCWEYNYKPFRKEDIKSWILPDGSIVNVKH